MAIPNLKEWKKLLQADLENVGNKKDDLIQVIRLCEDYSKEIKSNVLWLEDNQAFIEQIRRQYKELYQLRFGESPPENIEQPVIKQLKELRKEDQRNEILKLVQAKAPGSKILASEIKEALEQKGFIITASNPHAAISTTIASFKKDVEKSEGEHGVYFRKQPVKGMFSS
jgi:uncharacterized coiled-coil DUF342 family protein